MSRLCVLNCPNNYDMAPIIKHWHEIIKLGKSYYRHSGGSSLQNENHFRFRSRSVFISYHFYQFTLITCDPALIKCFFIRLIWPKEECTNTKIRSVFYVSTFFFFEELNRLAWILTQEILVFLEIKKINDVEIILRITQ